MPRLFRVFLVIALACLALPAAAAERVLLPAAGQSVSASATARAASVAGLRAQAGVSGRVRVIVGLRVPFAPAASLAPAAAQAQTAEIAAAAAGLRARFASVAASGEAQFRAYRNVPFVAMSVTRAELDRLAADPAVLSVTADRVSFPSLASSVPFIRANQAWTAGATGAGQTIAIIDTGVEKGHPFLANKVVAEGCFASDASCPNKEVASTAVGSGVPCTFAEDCSHGTHVAGIAAGKETGDFNASGVAKGANLIAIRAASFYPKESRSTFYDSDLLAALQYVQELAHPSNAQGHYNGSAIKAAAVNMSLGGGFFRNSCDTESPAITSAINSLVADGIAVVAASGNESYSNYLSWPACISSVISVGAVADSPPAQDDPPCLDRARRPSVPAPDRVVCFSNGSPLLSLLAPGWMITSSLTGGGYGTESGTSMAAPHVAGAIALLREKAPNATVAQLLQVLQSTGRRIVDWRDYRNVTSRIDVKAALDRLTAQTTDNLQALDLVIDGTGRGAVTFSPAGTLTSCTTTCSNRFAQGQTVTLTAAADARSQFGGWSGPCSGTGSCRVTLAAAARVTASFYDSKAMPQPLKLTVLSPDGGANLVKVTYVDLTQDCTTQCVVSPGAGQRVTLTPEPAFGYDFALSGPCSGMHRSCTVKMVGPVDVTATFTKLPTFVVKSTAQGSGGGTVSATIADGTAVTIASGGTKDAPAGSRVVLTATAAPGSRFMGWGGGTCRGGRLTCTFTIRTNVTVTATFN